MDRRRILLVVAVVVALLGTALVFLYVRGADARARRQFDTVDVLQAVAPIEAGETHRRRRRDRQARARSRWPATTSSRTTRPRSRASAGRSPRCASTPVSRSSRTSSARQSRRRDRGLTIPKGMIAISVSLTDTARVAGFVNPGTQVAIFLNGTDPAGQLFMKLLQNVDPGVFVPLAPNWGRNHRGVALRIPMSGVEDTRVEHRPGGADGNPYLVLAAILAGVHYGIANRIEPGPMVAQESIIDEKVELPVRWRAALDAFDAGKILPAYLSEKYHTLYGTCRREEEERFHAEISDRDYEWYLRAI